MNNKVITIDCDGVLMKKFMGRNWKVKPTKKAHNTSGKQQEGLENWWMSVIQLLRPMIEGVPHTLESFKKKKYTMYLVTSRGEHVRPATERWLQAQQIRNLFDDIVFNDSRIEPKDYKVERVKHLHADWHIDDDPETVELLAIACPNKRIIYFNRYNGRIINLPNVSEATTWKEIENIIG